MTEQPEIAVPLRQLVTSALNTLVENGVLYEDGFHDARDLLMAAFREWLLDLSQRSEMRGS